MICARCDEPIRDGEEYVKEINPGASGAGADIYLHKRPCERKPQQTYPSPRR